MRKKKIIAVSFLFLFTLVVSFTNTRTKDTSINIHYTLNYKDDSWGKNRKAILWTLSYLGAELPKNSFDRSIRWQNKTTFRINFDSLGFNPEALTALKLITDSLKQTPVYRKLNALDLGHFIALTLGSSWHYYQITGVPKTLAEFLELHKANTMEVFPLTKSVVSKGHRILKTHWSDTVINSAFIAEEGSGNVMQGNFLPKEYEVMDFMKNGQLRVMIYNARGDLIEAADHTYGEAGKPAKCIWCHEIYIPSLILPPDTVPGFMTPGEFVGRMKIQTMLLDQYRKTLNSDIDFSKTQDHAYQELAYISFMEPSLQKLSQEWNMPVKRIEAILKNKQKHIYKEYPFLGDLRYRKEIHELSPYKLGKIPGSVREENESEPNFFKN